MSWLSGLVVFLILWWLVFFVTLPFGIRAPHEAGETVGEGHADGAPVRPRLWLKAGIATAITAVLWGIAYRLIAAELISFRG